MPENRLAIMKLLLPLLGLALIARCLGAADAMPKNDLQTAIKDLGGKSNYSWTSTPKTEGTGVNWRQGPTEGKAEKGGYTYCRLTFNDNSIELAFKGDKGAIKREGEWQSAEELQGDNAWIARRLKAFKAPVAEAEDLLSKAKELKTSEGGLYSAGLSEAGAKELFSRLRRGATEPTDAKGSVKFWLKDGALPDRPRSLCRRMRKGNCPDGPLRAGPVAKPRTIKAREPVVRGTKWRRSRFMRTPMNFLAGEPPRCHRCAP